MVALAAAVPSRLSAAILYCAPPLSLSLSCFYLLCFSAAAAVVFSFGLGEVLFFTSTVLGAIGPLHCLLFSSTSLGLGTTAAVNSDPSHYYCTSIW